MRVEEIDGLRLVKRLAEDMEEMFHKKAQAMKVASPPRTHPCPILPRVASKCTTYTHTTQNNKHLSVCGRV